MRRVAGRSKSAPAALEDHRRGDLWGGPNPPPEWAVKIAIFGAIPSPTLKELLEIDGHFALVEGLWEDLTRRGVIRDDVPGVTAEVIAQATHSPPPGRAQARTIALSGLKDNGVQIGSVEWGQIKDTTGSVCWQGESVR